MHAENALVQCWRVQDVMVAENSESCSFVHVADTQARTLQIAASVSPGLRPTAHLWCQGEVGAEVRFLNAPPWCA